jgi:hypothetical protein
LDYIPTDLKGFALFMGDLAAAVTANKTRWGVPDDEATDLQSAFKTLFAETQDPTTITIVNYCTFRFPTIGLALGRGVAVD